MRDKVDLSGVIQQTLLEAHQGLRGQPDRKRSDEELAAWLRRILARNLADAVKAQRREKRDVARERHLADIEFEVAHHAPHGRDNWVHWNEVQGQVAARRGPILQGLRKTGVANDYR